MGDPEFLRWCNGWVDTTEDETNAYETKQNSTPVPRDNILNRPVNHANKWEKITEINYKLQKKK